MATRNYTITSTDGEVEVATAAENFLIEIRSQIDDVYLLLDEGSIPVDTEGHKLQYNIPAIRAGLDGAAKIYTDSTNDVLVIVSTGAIA